MHFGCDALKPMSASMQTCQAIGSTWHATQDFMQKMTSNDINSYNTKSYINQISFDNIITFLIKRLLRSSYFIELCLLTGYNTNHKLISEPLPV